MTFNDMPASASDQQLDLQQQVRLSIFENSPDCVKILNLDGSLLSMNKNGQCSMEIDDFGAVCGAMWPSLWPEESRKHVLDALDSARRGSIGQFEAFCPTAKGAPKWWDVVVSPLIASDGSLSGLMSISRDVTSIRQAVKRERSMAAKLRFALEVARYGGWDLNIVSGQLSFNPRFAQCFGVPDNVTPWSLAHWLDQVHTDDRAAVRNALNAAMSSESEFESEFRIVWPDRSIHWVHMLGSRYSGDEDGDHLTGLLSDVTGRAQDTEALKDDNRKKDVSVSLLEQKVVRQTADRDRMWRLSRDIMLVANFNAEILSLNPAWQTILGYDIADSIGADFMTLVHPDDAEETLREVGRLASGLTTLRFENRYRHADGSWKDISWTAVPDADLLHAVGRDITEEKKAALALQETEAALHQSQKLESLGKLTGGVAHDFNNVLQIISGNLQLLQIPDLDKGQVSRRLASANLAVERGARLAAQLLSFARRHPLKPTVTDLGPLLYAMDELLKRALGETVDVEIAVKQQLWHTLIDPNQLENVVLNLAINARDAMQGQGKLTIELSNAELDDGYCARHTEVEPGQYVLLAVSDTGSGMSADLLTKIFEPFFTTKREGEGTGLGLSMAYGFVKQSGGHIKVYSETGNGTTFRIYLPRSVDKLDVVEVVEDIPVTGGTETVLVVEDDPQVQDIVVETLKGLGYTVFKADSAGNALAIVRSGIPIDMLFTDVVMPGELRSPELAQQAKTLLPDLVVLYTSGYTQNAIVHGGRLDAGVELLSKPYKREDLARKVRTLLDNSKGMR